MLSIRASWSGQTFALPRCSDSTEKKTRRRLSKDKRRTLVESFIKRYQGSNNGDFPSLNLTHKEVGGSFYTVREIVRELIQENRVLRPGKPSSTSLSLEDCLEEYPVGSLSMAPDASDQEEDDLLLSSENQVLSEESYETVSSESVDLLNNSPTVCTDSPVMHVKPSDRVNHNSYTTACPDEGSMGVDSDVKDPDNSFRHIDDHSEANQYIYSEFEVHMNSSNHTVEQPVILGNPVFSNSTPTKLEMKEELVNGSERNSIAKETEFSLESNGVAKATGQEAPPEPKTLSNSGNHDLSTMEYSASVTKEVPSVASVAAKSCDSEESVLEETGSSISPEGMHSSLHEMKAVSKLAEGDPAIMKTEHIFVAAKSCDSEESVLEETGSSISPEGIHSSLHKMKAVSKLAEGDPAIMKTEHISSTQINGAVTRLSSPMPLSSGSAETESVLEHRHKDKNGTYIGSYSLGSPCSNDRRVPSDPAKAECKDITNRSHKQNTLKSTSGTASEESEKEEINPVWAAVKAFVASFVKFWTE